MAFIAGWIIITDQVVVNIILTIWVAVLTLVWMYKNFRDLVVIAKSSRGQFMVNTFIRSCLLFFTLALMNYLLFKHPVSFDFSKNGTSSLSPQSVRVVKQLAGDLKFIIFVRKENQKSIEALLDLYRFVKADITFELYDPDLRPDMVKKYNITQDGTVVVIYRGRQEKALANKEINITNALIRVGRKDKINVCLSRGHGELNFKSANPKGAKFAKSLLEKMSYELVDVVITQEGIPKTCNLLVILDPQTGFLDREIDAIKSYLKHNGKLFLGLGPTLSGAVFSNLREMLTDYGLTLNNDFVVDRLSYVNGSSGLIPLIRKLSSTSTITKDMPPNIFFPLVSSIDTFEGRYKGKVEVLAKTSNFPASWAEKNLQEMLGQKVTFTDGVDVRGANSVAISWDKLDAQKHHTKLVLVGNGSFLQNKYQKFKDNFTFFMNAVAWLTDEDQLSAFTDIVLDNGSVVISATLRQVLFYFSLFFAPLIFFIIAFVIYNRRKNI